MVSLIVGKEIKLKEFNVPERVHDSYGSITIYDYSNNTMNCSNNAIRDRSLVILDAHASPSKNSYNINLCNNTSSLAESMEQLKKNNSFLNFELFACLSDRGINEVINGSTLITLTGYNYTSLEPLDNELIIKAASFIPHNNPFVRLASYIMINPIKPKFIINIDSIKKIFPNDNFTSEISTEDLISQNWRYDMLVDFIQWISSIKDLVKNIDKSLYDQIEHIQSIDLLKNDTWYNQFNITRSRELSFINAVHTADIDKVRVFLDSDLNINTTLESGANALHIATQAIQFREAKEIGLNSIKLKMDYYNIVIMLIEAGICLDDLENGGVTALHMAISEKDNFIEVALALIKANASLNVESSFGDTPIHRAAQNGHFVVVEALLEKSTIDNISIVDTQIIRTDNNPGYTGRTALDASSLYGYKDIVEILIDNKASVNLADCVNMTALCYTVSRRYIEIAEILINYGADVNHMCDSGDHLPLLKAINNNDLEMVRLLLASGADIDSNMNNTNVLVQEELNLYKENPFQYEECYNISTSRNSLVSLYEQQIVTVDKAIEITSIKQCMLGRIEADNITNDLHIPTLLLKNETNKKGVVTIELENKSLELLKIYSSSLLLDGFKSDKFDITDQETGYNLPYQGRLVKYIPDIIELPELGKITSILDLKEVYDLEECHQYNVVFETVLFIGDESLMLSGSTSIAMDCGN